MRTHLLKRSFKTAMLAGASLSILSSLAVAQDTPVAGTPVPVDAAAAGEEEVVVTGSRIRQPNLTSATSTVVVDSKRVQLSGEVNTADILRDVPQIGISTLSSVNSSFVTQGGGVNTVDLRNLGESRTLVLVNSRRFVSGLPGSQIVDFNMIPTALIDRIDVVTGGASAIYGSDALAGVVNVILKRNFTGVNISAQHGWLENYDDAQNSQINVTAGSDFADGKGNAVFNLSWSKEDGANARDRAGTAIDCTASVLFGLPGDYSSEECPTFSSYAEGGVFRLTNSAFEASIQRVIDPVTGELRSRVPTDGYNRQSRRQHLVPLERYVFTTLIDYEVQPDQRIFFEGTFASTESLAAREPFALDSDNIYGVTEQVGQSQGIVAGIPLTNPYIPAALLALANERGANAIGFQRRLSEFGDRFDDTDRQTGRFVIGAAGEITEGWNYELAYNWGQTTETQFSNGQINAPNFRNALNSIVLNGQVVCADPIARAQGCIPVNPFVPVGEPANWTQEQLDYLKADSTRDIKISQEVVSFVVDGELFELPAGPVQSAFGIEYREEESSDRPDPLTQAGQNGSNRTAPTFGRFDVREAFAEFEIPLVADESWAKELNLNLAVRGSDYSTVGDTFAWSSSLSWAVTDDIRFRGQYARAVRAPDISELFQGQSEDFAPVVDPCDSLRTAAGGGALEGGPTDPTVIANCLANPGIAARANTATGFVLTLAEQQGTGGFSGGNPDLDAETADTWTIGFVFTPKFADWLEGMTLSVDYFNIKIEDTIADTGRQRTLTNCYAFAAAGNPFCEGVVRDVNGAVDEVNTTVTNNTTLETSGIDALLAYRFELNDVIENDGDLGMLTLSINYQWLDKYTETFLPGTEFENVDESVGLLGTFRHKAQFGVLYEIDDFTFNVDATFVSKAHNFNYDSGYNSNLAIGEFYAPEDRKAIPSQWFFDTQVRYAVIENATLVFGVRNVFDNSVKIGSGTGITPTGWDTDPDSYDGLGRRYYFGVNLSY